MTVLHASGHATPADLERIAEAIDAQRVVPLTRGTGALDAHFERVERHPDGEWWDV